MLIEYKIKFEKDGVTITQRVEPNASNRREESSIAGKPIFSKLLGEESGDPDPSGLEKDPEIVGGGGGPGSSGRVIAFGPVIFCDSDGTVAVLPGKDLDAEKQKPAPPTAPVTPKNK